ncbi:MAG: TRASH domain-containing protein [Verrucomicrobiota bacterium]
MKSLKTISRTVMMGGILAVSLAAFGADHKEHGGQKTEKAKPYPLATCVVSDEKLGGDMGEPYIFTYQGREFKLCCKSCLKDFDKDQAKYVAKWDAAARKVKPYPLKTCLVSGEKLGGDMGEPFEFIHERREMKLCCKDCLKEFNKNTGQFIKKLEEAEKAKK